MGRRRKRRCACCGEYFLPGPYNHCQRFCGKAACREASSKKSHWRYRRLKSLDEAFKESERARLVEYRRRKARSAGYRESERERSRRYRRGLDGGKKDSAIPPPPAPDAAGTPSEASRVRDLDNFYLSFLFGLMSLLSDGGDEGAAAMGGRLHDMGSRMLSNLNITDGNVMSILSAVRGVAAGGAGDGART